MEPNAKTTAPEITPLDTGDLLEKRVGTRLCGLSWLSERVAVLVFETIPFQEHHAELSVMAPEDEVPLLSDAHTFPLSEAGGREGRVIVAILPEGAESGAEGLRVLIRSRRRTMWIEPEQLERHTMDVRTLLRTELAGLPVPVRNELLQLMASASEWQSGAGGGVALSRSLHLTRDGLREPLPISARDRAEPQGLNVDLLLALDARSFWIKGWAQNVEGRPSRLTAVAPEGLGAELLHGAHWHDRPDVRRLYGHGRATADDHPGFLHFFELPGPSRLPEGWLCEMHCSGGLAVEVEAPEVVRDPLEVRNRILTELSRPHDNPASLARNHVHPAVQRLQRRLIDSVDIARLDEYGAQPERPDVSVIIPLYRRLDLLEYQLAELVHDPEFKEVELVFVLDSPELRDRLHGIATELQALFGVSFRIAVLKDSAGFPTACNLGAQVARGRLLTFLHSDVLPSRPGWLGKMRAFYDQVPGIGALGPKLVYEDGTVESAGLYFHKPPGDSVWETSPLLRGLHARFPLARQNRTVAAVSAACLMVDRALFEEVGRFRDEFVQGGYEDSDLCLRLDALGRESWCLGGVELFHLGAQSFGEGQQGLTGTYNRWLHDALWADMLAAVEDRFPVSGLAPIAADAQSHPRAGR